MQHYRIVEEQKWTLRGRVTKRRIVGAPCWQALQAWRDGGDIQAPSIDWLLEAVSDAIDEMNRRA
jgi:hypothetical protein